MAAMTDQDLIARYIERDPYYPGEAEARVNPGWIHVWAIIGELEGLDGDVPAVAEGFRIPCEAVEAALAYYRRHKAAIDARLHANRQPG